MADYVGSLVVPGQFDRGRSTNWDGVGPRPAGVAIQDFAGLIRRRDQGGAAVAPGKVLRTVP